MFLSEMHFYSESLGLQTSVNVLMPDPGVIAQSKAPVPVLYLLHGLSGDHSVWMRQTSLERYARRWRVCIVMPDADKSYYMDMAYGAKYETYIAKELPEMIERSLPFVSKKREGRFVAGLSMGGFGALKLALAYPARYRACATLSGALGVGEIYSEKDTRPEYYMKMMDLIFDGPERLARSTGNINRAAEKLCHVPEKCPSIYIACGTEDQLLGANERFVERFAKRLPIEYHTSAGAHTWDFWDEYIKKVIEWLPLEAAK